MSEGTANPLDAVSSLLEERQRFENWLSTLESRRASTPPHVYARVHADYDKRLGEVIEQLANRTGELQQMTHDLRGRIDRLQEQENALRDERAEAELRSTVGEYTPQQWDELRERSDASIQKLSAEGASLREELARLDELLRTATSPRRSGGQPEIPAVPAPAPAAAASAETAAPAAPPAMAAAPAAAPEPARAEERPAARAPEPDPLRDSRAFDELAFLQSVVEPRGRASAGTNAPASAPRAAAPAAPPAEVRATPASAPTVDGASRGDDNAPRATAPGRRMPEPSDAPPPKAPAPEEARSASRESVPSFLKDIPNEQVKTLKCQECGTMNYPTEWYCERCGGELAAM